LNADGHPGDRLRSNVGISFLGFLSNVNARRWHDLPMRRPLIVVLVTAMLAACGSDASSPGGRSAGSLRDRAQKQAAVLLFTRTAGFRHASIPAAVAAIEARAAGAGLTVEATEDSGAFNDLNLSRFDAVVFLLTTGDVLDPAQEAALERFVRKGGGYAGVHSATDTEYDWPFYGSLVGAYFKDHPPIQPATVVVDDRDHPSTSMLPATWPRTDEWYNFRAQPVDAEVLARVEETTYTGGSIWADARFVDHVIGGIAWATGLR